MSVVGVDLGTINTVIAVARNRGVDVVRALLFFLLSALCSLYLSGLNTDSCQITNEVSNRATPYVSPPL